MINGIPLEEVRAASKTYLRPRLCAGDRGKLRAKPLRPGGG